jgi:uncharacterized membrane protein HdeD (DUF308 family)
LNQKNKQIGSSPSRYYYYAAGATTAIAGILHLILFSNGIARGVSEIGIFFLISGLIQLFWVLPMVKRWGRTWYYIGIGGTLALIILWGITREPNSFTHGRALPINSMSIVTELFEFAFIALSAIIIWKERTSSIPELKQS